jgi:RNA polymerase sigma factor (sigma-70 family)
VNLEQIFLDNLTTIDSVVRQISRHHRLSADEREEFRSESFRKLIDDDYAVLRKYRSQSSLRTYIQVVLEKLLLDRRNHLWGKWRPSAAARQAGSIGIDLERLMHRDRLPFAEAVTMLRAKGVTESDEQLLAIAAALPPRVDRRPQDVATLRSVADRAPLPDSHVDENRLRGPAVHTSVALDRAMAELDPEDRLILRLCYWERVKVVDIARTLDLVPKALYRRIDQLLTRLRASLERQGAAEDARGVVNQMWSDLVVSRETV